MHLDMDAFFASVEQLTRPTLQGRPVLVGGAGGRGVVAGASYAARAFGAHSAMPMHQARRMVGAAAVVLPPRGAVYSTVSKQVFDLLRTRIPVLETLSLDEAFGEPVELAGASAAEVEALGVRIGDPVAFVSPLLEIGAHAHLVAGPHRGVQVVLEGGLEGVGHDSIVSALEHPVAPFARMGA